MAHSAICQDPPGASPLLGVERSYFVWAEPGDISTALTQLRHRERDAALDWPLMLSFVPGILPESDEGDGKIR